MSDNQPEYLEPAAGAPLPRGPRSRRPLLAAGAGVAGAALLGGAAWGAWWWFADGAQAAESLPASAVAYVGLTLDPSGSQKVEALRTLQEFPAISDELDLDGSPTDIDLKEALGSAFLATAPCDLSYADDLEPWLGDRLGVAAFLVDDEPQPLATFEVTDESAARDSLAELVACGTDEASAPEAAFEVRDGWALLAPTRDVLDAALAVLDEGSLADDEDFRSWTEQAGDTGIVTMYAAPSAADLLGDVLGPGLAGLTGAGYGSTEDEPDADQQVADALAGFEGAAAQVRFADGAVELEMAAGVEGGDRLSGGGDAADLVGSLPDDTVLAAGSSLGEELLADLDRQTTGGTEDGSGDGTGDDLGGLDEMTDDLLGGFFAPDDLDLPALLGDAVALAVGPDLDLEGLFSGTTTDVPVAVLTTGERSAADDAATGLGAGLGALLGTEPSVAGEDGRVVLGLSPAWADEVARGGSLGDQDAYRDALPGAEDASSLLFVDFDAVLDLVTSSIPDGFDDGESEAELADNLGPLRALGVTGSVDEDRVRVLLRLTTD
jgi:hypothetical protein